MSLVDDYIRIVFFFSTVYEHHDVSFIGRIPTADGDDGGADGE